MASLSDILTAIQNGVIAVNGLAQQIGILFGLINPRRKLTTATTFYIGDGTGGVGNDSLAGTTAATAWLTFAHAAAVISGQIDFGGQTVTLQAVAGHANFTTGAVLPDWVGGGALIFDCGGGSIAITGTGTCITSPFAALPGTITIQNVTLSSTGGTALDFRCPGSVNLGSGVTFGACPNGLHFSVLAGCRFVYGSYTITGAAFQHWRCDAGGIISNGGLPITITLSGTPAFNTFAVALEGGLIEATNANFSGSATGKRYSAISNGIIDTSNSGPNFLPGNTAGTTGTQGQYL